ncbi:hypothetical protein H5410_000772 [Solanum commersonii]|uniref:Uncharacterized protein n=1 Tax=Solanum commersonii TaxID=4109 RepID=A0A9J6AY76_SOLCO|nr:hypothetical protein H5410_000772 [Solanum commersonii]
MPDQVLPLQIDESQVCLGNIKFPNLALHNIVSHNQLTSELMEDEKGGTKILKEVKEDQIIQEVDLSPRTIIAIKTSRKGKK